MNKILLLSLLLSGRCCFGQNETTIKDPQAEDKIREQKWKKIAEPIVWDWRDERATASYCAAKCSGKYKVHFEKRNDPTPEYYDVTFWVTRGNRKICRWIGHKFTVFDIYGDRLYYALFDPRQHSGKIVAVNLLSGTKLWESDLINPSIFAGSFYENRIILEAHKDRVVIFGRDTAGDYIEIKDSKSGDTIGQKVVKKNFGGT